MSRKRIFCLSAISAIEYPLYTALKFGQQVRFCVCVRMLSVCVHHRHLLAKWLICFKIVDIYIYIYTHSLWSITIGVDVVITLDIGRTRYTDRRSDMFTSRISLSSAGTQQRLNVNRNHRQVNMSRCHRRQPTTVGSFASSSSLLHSVVRRRHQRNISVTTRVVAVITVIAAGNHISSYAGFSELCFGSGK